jgi:5-hydroxyisourate hydrolase
VCRWQDDLWQTLAEQKTNRDGRVEGLLPSGRLTPGLYRVKFGTQSYFNATACEYSFYPQPCIDFQVTLATADQKFHIPLLISPFAYSTYRGS